jgi:D-threonate/D-erythronate kinase
MRRMVMIADDLSGAADCGIACANHGLPTVVLLDGAEGGSDVEVLAVDADTRWRDQQSAARVTARLVCQYASDDRCLFFKKLDSTLRGHVAAELAAALEVRRSGAGGRVVAVMAPAFPANGRTTANGRQFIHGRPLEESEIWQREHLPARSHIPEMLAEARLNSAVVSTACVRSGVHSLQEAIRRLADEADVIVCDAETDEDLRAIATASMVLGPRTVWAGSAGLAYHLPLVAGFTQTAVSAPDVALADGPTLFVIGSLSGVSREQAAILAARGDVVTVNLSPHMLIEGAGSQQWKAHEQELGDAVEAGTDVMLLPDSNHRMTSEQGPLLCSALAKMAAHLAGRVGALVATGGESARAVLHGWGVNKLRLLGELETGLPVSVTEGWSRALPVLTKAGGFGTPQTLLRCHEFLRELDRNSARNLLQGKRS